MSQYTNEEVKTIAVTIMAQLGGPNRLKAMIGAHSFVYGREPYPNLTFRFKAASKNKAKCVRVEYLDGSDLYRLTFLKMEYQKIGSSRIPVGVKEVSVHEGLYADQLKELVERETGLALSL